MHRVRRILHCFARSKSRSTGPRRRWPRRARAAGWTSPMRLVVADCLGGDAGTLRDREAQMLEVALRSPDARRPIGAVLASTARGQPARLTAAIRGACSAAVGGTRPRARTSAPPAATRAAFGGGLRAPRLHPIVMKRSATSSRSEEPRRRARIVAEEVEQHVGDLRASLGVRMRAVVDEVVAHPRQPVGSPRRAVGP